MIPIKGLLVARNEWIWTCVSWWWLTVLLHSGKICLIIHCLTFFWFHSSCCYYLWVLKLYLCSDFALNFKFCLVLLFQMYSDIFSSVPNVSVFHVPTFFFSPCSKHALFSMFQTCSVLYIPNLFCSLYSKLVLFSIYSKLVCCGTSFF